MKEIKNCLLKIVFSFLICFGIACTVNAADLTLTGSDKIPVTRNVLKVSNPVVNTFGYEITAATDNPAAVTNAPTAFDIDFDGSETINSNTVTKQANIDFDETVFTAPGNYAFLVKEVSSDDEVTYPVSGDTYYVYISVRYDTTANDGTLVATVLTQGKLENTGSKRDLVYPADSAFTNISVTKKVTGDMGDVSRYFPIKVTVPGNVGDVYAVTGGSYASNPTEINAGEETVFYLKSDDTIVIGLSGELNQIPIGKNYTVSEDEVENYTTTIDDQAASTLTKVTAMEPDSNKTVVVNDYSIASLTGVIINVLPFVILIGFAVVGFVIFTKKKN